MQFEHNLSNHYYSVGHTFLPLCNTVHILFFPRAGRMTKAQLPWQPRGYLLAPIRQPDRHNALVWKESPKTPEKHTGTHLERCWAIQNRNSIKGLSVSRKNEKIWPSASVCEGLDWSHFYKADISICPGSIPQTPITAKERHRHSS